MGEARTRQTNTDWSRYAPHVPPHRGPQKELNRAEARETYASWHAQRGERWEQLQRLVPEGLTVGPSDAELQGLNDWFRQSVEADPQDPSRLARRWYAVVNDVAVVLGDVAIGRFPHLRWAFFTSAKRHPAYQKQVLTGFANVEAKDYVVDLDARVANYAYRITDRAEVDPAEFVKILDFLRTIA